MKFHLAQINIGRIAGPMDSPVMAEFKDNLDRINELAERSAGFVWRLKDDSNNATTLKFFDDERIIINMSVWESVDALTNYAYKTEHVEFIRKRLNWFEKMHEAHMALWYIPAGHVPTPAEAIERLTHLRTQGESQHAFTFRKKFAPAVDGKL
jgi:hypothetical protein